MAQPRHEGDAQRPDHLTWRHRVLAGLVALMIAGLVGRLVQIQIIDHDFYAEQAAVLRYGASELSAPRGAILDATGYPLAASIDTWDVYLDSFLWQQREYSTTSAIELAALLGLDADAVMALGLSQERGDVLIARDISYEAGNELRAMELWAVRALPSTVRVYPEVDLAGPLIGYVGIDGNGLWGIEADFDYVLRGRAGFTGTERDLLGRPIAFGPLLNRAAAPGGEVHLTIDRFLQSIVERRLDEAIEKHGARSGSIIVMDPHTGAVLAIASRPAVAISRLDFSAPDFGSLVRIRPITDLYEPGSVLKTLTTAAALDLGLVTPETTYIDEGFVEIGTDVIRNWDFLAYGEVTLTEFLQRSLNTGAVWLSNEIGKDDFYRYLQAFGLGETTHIGLSGEADGIMRTPDRADWNKIDLATNAYGQGLAATPLQVLTAINSFANGGLLMRPYLVSKIVSADEVRVFEPVEVRRVVKPSTARTMARLMLEVVEGVAYHGARVPGYRVAGKTGTTLVSIPTGYDLDTTIASFAGFLPYEAPRVSILVKIDQPAGERNLGGEVAAPTFALVAADIMEYLDVPRIEDVVATP